MSQLLSNPDTLQTLTIEALTGVDGQGAPQYATGVPVSGRAVRKDDVVRGVTPIGAPGEEVVTVATVWVGAEEELLPEHGARISTEDGLVGIVVERKEVRNLRYGTLDHVRVKLRKE